MPCHMSSSAGWEAFADSQVHLLEYVGIWYCFSFVVSGKTKFHPIVYIQNAQNEMGNSKMPPKWRKFFDCPPPPPPHGPPPAYAAAVGV